MSSWHFDHKLTPWSKTETLAALEVQFFRYIWFASQISDCLSSQSCEENNLGVHGERQDLVSGLGIERGEMMKKR